MTNPNEFTNMRSLMTGLAKAMNLVNPAIENHHEQTAYLSLFIARGMGLPESDVTLAVYAALLHDIGSIVVEVPLSVREVEKNAHEVSQVGSRMLADLPGFSEVASVIGYSQCSWRETVAHAIEEGSTCERLGKIASIVHLADTVSLFHKPEERILNQVKDICDFAKSCSGFHFCPEAVDALQALSGTEYIWMDFAHNPMFLTYFTGDIAPVSLEKAVQLTSLVSRIIDYRSPFTAMHSAGVAASARTLAELAGLGEECVMQMEIAGNLHDIGKLAVPREILEKPGKLTEEEFGIMREHPYYTALILMGIDGFGQISDFASRHHEKLDGSGYPFHFGKDELTMGQRIMAVADIFSAITEERPYRAGMSRAMATKVLRDDAQAGKICSDMVELLIDNYDQVDAARDEMSRFAGKRYFESLGDQAA